MLRFVAYEKIVDIAWPEAGMEVLDEPSQNDLDTGVCRVGVNRADQRYCQRCSTILCRNTWAPNPEVVAVTCCARVFGLKSDESGVQVAFICSPKLCCGMC